MNIQPEPQQPWYRQFWPWFIIALPATVVVASLSTVYIAFKHADALVNDNYFKEGLAINMRLEQDQLAEQLQLRAHLTWDAATGDLMSTLNTQSDSTNLPVSVGDIEQLLVQLVHPAKQDKDRQVILHRVTPGYFRGSLDQPLTQRYYIRLSALPDLKWRLSGEMDFGKQASLTLGQ